MLTKLLTAYEQDNDAEIFALMIHAMHNSEVSHTDIKHFITTYKKAAVKIATDAASYNIVGLLEYLQMHGITNAIWTPVLDEGCLKGHIEVVVYAIIQGARIRANKDYSLILACRGGNIKIVELLLSQDVPINARGGEALTMALKYKHPELAKYLINHGIRLDHEEESKMTYMPNKTPIDYALEGGYLEIIKMMEERGMDINMLDHRAMGIAIKENHVEVVRHLMSKGIQCHNSRKEEVLEWAIRTGQMDIVEYFASHVSIEIKTEASHHAAEQGNLEMYRYLNPTGRYSNIAITRAGYNDHLHIIEYIMREQADTLNYCLIADSIDYLTCDMRYDSADYVIGRCHREALDIILYQCILTHNEQGIKQLMKYTPDLPIIHDQDQNQCAKSILDNPSITKCFLKRGMDIRSMLKYKTATEARLITSHCLGEEYLLKLIPKYERLHPNVLGELEKLHSRIWRWRSRIHQRMLKYPSDLVILAL